MLYKTYYEVGLGFHNVFKVRCSEGATYGREGLVRPPEFGVLVELVVHSYRLDAQLIQDVFA